MTTIDMTSFITKYTNFDDFKTELSKKDSDDKKVYNIGLKENDTLAIVFYLNASEDAKNSSLENTCKSIIIEKATMKIIGSQFNKIIHNQEADALIKCAKWNNVTVQKCYEGTIILVFFHGDTWYVSTRRCLDAHESVWIRGLSYYDMFVETMKNKFTFDNLNKNYCYHFILVHHMNKNIVVYPQQDAYKELYHVQTTELYTLKEVPNEKIKNVKYVENESFESYDKLKAALTTIDTHDKNNKQITCEGYILKLYSGDVHNSPFLLLKLQTDVYQNVISLKPNNSNIHQCFLELYQKNKLNSVIMYFTNNSANIIKRIKTSMQTLSTEILHLYHSTRQMKNKELYDVLSKTYRQVLYKVHGEYIERMNKLTENKTKKINNVQLKLQSINVYNVYDIIKGLQPKELRQLYYDRMMLVNNKFANFINRKCIATTTQCSLMFAVEK